jgi:curved DNA-binding protein CbpA
MKDYYKILRLKRFATSEEVKSAFKELAKIYHPDTNKGQAFYNDYFREIKDAYEFLIDNSNKIKYDDFLNENPDLVEQMEIVKRHPQNVNSWSKGLKKNKLVPTFILLIGITLVLFTFIYLQQSKNQQNKIIFERDSIARENLKIKKARAIQENLRRLDEVRQLSLKRLEIKANATAPSLAHKPNVSKKSINVDWCENVRVLFTESSPFVVIVNENNFEIDKVTCHVSFKPYMGFNNLIYPPSEDVSFLNIKPGKNQEVLHSEHSDILFMNVSYCNDYGR